MLRLPIPDIRFLASMLAVLALLPVSVAQAQPAGDLIEYVNQKYGFALSLPASTFVAGESRNPNDGGLWISRDAQARLIAVASPNLSMETVASYREFVMANSYKKAAFDYTPVRDDWFVLSGRMGSEMFYERVTFACDGRYIYGWQLMYPAAQRRRYDRIVEAIHRSYRPGRGEDGKCGGDLARDPAKAQ